MRVVREAKQKIQTNKVYIFSSFGYTMECTRTTGILIKIVRKDIMLQHWKFQSFTRVLLGFAPSLRPSQESGVEMFSPYKLSVFQKEIYLYLSLLKTRRRAFFLFSN